MNERIKTDAFEGKRLLSVEELTKYLGLGRHASRQFAGNVGAVKRYGKRVLFDRVVIDAALDQMGEQLAKAE